MKIKKYFDKIIIGLCIILFISIGVFNRKSFVKEEVLEESKSIDQETKKIVLNQEKNDSYDKPKQTNEAERKESGEICVDISGLIRKPGVYRLKQGSRLIDLVEMAGGLLEGYDSSKINLSIKLKDEMKIHIDEKGSGLKSEEETKNFTGKININNASKEELMTIKGIGSKKADDIIEYRGSKKFDTIEEIKEISGFGVKTFERIKDKITVND